MEFARDWAHLPLELLIIIASRIECLRDLVIFSAVCPLWHTAFSMAKYAWTPKMPWLMLAEKHEDNPRCLRMVYDPATKKQYQMELPETFGRYCHGCGDGWILTLGLDMEIHLFNPHTRARLSLPPAQTLPSLDRHIDFDKPGDRAKVRAEVIRGVTLLRTRSNNELVVVLVYYDYMVTFARPGDSSWRGSEGFSPALDDVQAVVPCGNNAMVIYENGAVAAFDVDSFFPADQTPREGEKYEPDQERDLMIVPYYVQSGGGLLAVQEYHDFVPDIGNRAIDFCVFKFDFKASEWEQIYELGDVALFVGNNTSIALRASDSAACGCNCIYFTESRFPRDDIKLVGKDMGVYSMEHHFFYFLYHLDGGVTTSEFCPPFFYTPKLV